MKKRNGFTLAEVLITLTIIGVIAALTIPNLMQKWENHSNFVAMKNSYSLLKNVSQLVIKEYGSYSEWGPQSMDKENLDVVVEKFEPYLKYTKKCRFINGCWEGAAKKLHNEENIENRLASNEFISYLLPNGIQIAFILGSDAYPNSTYFYGMRGNSPRLIIAVDVNGKRGKHRMGRDVFAFYIPKDDGHFSEELLMAGDKTSANLCTTNSEETNNNSYTRRFNGMGCTYKAFKEGGINY